MQFGLNPLLVTTIIENYILFEAGKINIIYIDHSVLTNKNGVLRLLAF